jgi:REP element-mobilizing transposase RayT
MPRVDRQDEAGVCHHVVLRGIERRAIFQDDLDRLDFVARLKQQLDDSRARCLAWVLMTNHVHLVLLTGTRPLSKLMRRLGGGYARSYNLRHGRRGYLFEDRFHSTVVSDDAYLRVLVRYVHRNPLRARMVDSLDALSRYPWSGHAEIVRSEGFGVLAKPELSALFGVGAAAQRALIEWMSVDPASIEDGAHRCRHPILVSESALGDPATVEMELNASHRAPWDLPGAAASDSRALRLRRAGWTLDALIAWVCARLGADPFAVRAGRRTLSAARARAAIAALATRDLGLTIERVARATGITPGPLCRAIDRGSRVATEFGLDLDAAEAIEKGKKANPTSPSATPPFAEGN